MTMSTHSDKNAGWCPACVALAAALLFGASTPAAKLLIDLLHPQLLAGLLYLGSGVGLFSWRMITGIFSTSNQHEQLTRSDWPWLAGAIVFGGIIAPVLLMAGLNNTTGGTASLLLNLEAVFTAALAWFVFKENFDRRIFVGMTSIVAGGIFLTWQTGSIITISSGALAIVAACLCWALDNSLTRNIADDCDPVQIAATKGLVAGLVNCGIALAYGSHLPSLPTIVGIACIGLFGYGVSLVLFIKALKNLGTARASAYFSTAPFAGAALSLLLLDEPLTTNLLIASGFMAFGVWLHLTERHEHEHSHPKEIHEHMHRHDENHVHEHDQDAPLTEPHSHRHEHQPVVHFHPHYPDSRHRHDH
jgi:drug/metabolite transporter (DMT)-like permease